MRGVKKQSVCKGCRYYIDKSPAKGQCGYMEATKQSRLKVELENGGYKEDSCVCYEKKQGKGRKRKE